MSDIAEKLILRGGAGRLAVHLYLAEASTPSPAVILCHGLTSCKENYADLAKFLRRQGFVALAFDCRGHGESDGGLDGQAWQDVGTALAYLRTRSEVDPEHIGAVGASMGAHNALCAAAEHPELRTVVALCTASEIILQYGLFDPEHWHEIQHSGGQVRVTLPDYLAYLERHNIYQVVPRIRPRPVFFIHARDDEFVPFTVSERLHAVAGSGSRLWLLDSGGHQGPRHDPQVMQAIAVWLQDKLK